MKFSIYIFLIVFILFGCNKEETENSSQEEPLQIDESKNDTIILADTTILFLFPSDREIVNLKKKHGEEDFYIIADDVAGYSANLSEKLDQHNLKHTSSDARYIYIKRLNKLIDKDTINGKWSIVYLDFNNNIKIVDPINFNIETVVRKVKSDVAGWAGKYSCTIDYGKLDELSSAVIGYQITVSNDSIIFSGMGYQTDFVYACNSVLDTDTLKLSYLKTLEGVEYKGTEDYIAKIYKEDGGIFVKSPVIYILKDKEQVNNYPVLLKLK